MKRLIYILTLFFLLGTPFTASAVTDKEMEQARTIATKAYLRYANDGSGYLDKLNPKTMAELEKNLKPKEKENLKAFKAIPVPSDYASWNKQKLVEYWGVTAFSSKGLVEKGRLGRNRAKKHINAMSVTPPQKESAKNDKKPAADKGDVKKNDKIKDGAAEKSAQEASASAGTPAAEPAPADSTESALTSAQAIDNLNALDSEPQIKKANNHTWVYILILCVLVAVVVALVVFASNVMKKNEEAVTDATRRVAQHPESPAESADTNALREKFAATLTSKNDEIRSLSKKLEDVNAQNFSLKSKLEAVTAESASLRCRVNEYLRKIAEMEAKMSAAEQAHAAAAAAVAQAQATAPAPAPENAEVPQPAPTQPAQVTQAAQAVAHPQQKAASTLRTIFLGRANAKGIFVRADRTLNLGNSIFRLDTSDGYAGSFRVAADPTVWEMAMLTPRESLAGACVVADLDITDGMHKIVNDSAGTAIFEGGCWKVIRKAKIHFE